MDKPYELITFTAHPQLSTNLMTHQLESPRHGRTTTACEACRLRKTRCDSARPACSKCVKRNIICEYPDTDPLATLDTWGSKILGAIERQERILTENLITQRGRINSPRRDSSFGEDDLEAMSRNDSLNTPITGADMILNWPIFPKEKPFRTFPPSSYSEKPDRFHPEATLGIDIDRMRELLAIFAIKIYIKSPIVDFEQIYDCLARIAENGIDSSASSCLIALICALAAIWGNFPEPDTRELSCQETPSSPSVSRISVMVPDQRMAESLAYLDLARKRMSAAYLDDSLLGVQCYCLFGLWYLYNVEPIMAWRMFRTASTMWQTYNLKHRAGIEPRTIQEKSLEQMLYWTCLKSECEIRYELADLPPCTLSLSDFPFSFPSFAARMGSRTNQIGPISSEVEEASSYYCLADISLRRLMNRIRNAIRILSPDVETPVIEHLTFTLSKLEGQLQQWIDCLTASLKFSLPLTSQPPADEHELVRLVRERYVEARELLCRPFLYLCIHVPLEHRLIQPYGKRASEALQLAVYRIQTENPFFRHPGSWGSCRIRFNHALCLIAAIRAKARGVEAAAHINIPPTSVDSIHAVIERLQVWSEEGAGTGELSLLLEWLMQSEM
ncbi:hypothetical protein J3E69DRAFT_337485 [Trichoderma sp. SZMC 28015]